MTDWIDPDDASPLDAAWFAKAEIRKGGEVVRPRQTTPTVLQIDREAAEQLWGKASLGQPMSESWPTAFAAHREQAVAEMVEALDWAISEIEGRTRYDPDPYNGAEQRDNALDCARLALTKANGDAS